MKASGIDRIFVTILAVVLVVYLTSTSIEWILS